MTEIIGQTGMRFLVAVEKLLDDAGAVGIREEAREGFAVLIDIGLELRRLTDTELEEDIMDFRERDFFPIAEIVFREPGFGVVVEVIGEELPEAGKVVDFFWGHKWLGFGDLNQRPSFSRREP